MYLCIQNQGEIDPNALTLLGVSVKEEDSIGFFGSGNKYALACILRNKLEIKIFSGLNEIKIDTVKQTFKSEEFDVITVNGQSTSITTRTGPKWYIRDAIREFYSNALDEGKGEKFTTNSICSLPGQTRIYIKINDEIQDMLDSWSTYFLTKTNPLHEGEHGSIYDQQPSNYFRRGVWICEDTDQRARFSYDFNDFNLPESRKVSSYFANFHIKNILRDCRSEFVWTTILNNADTSTCEREYYSLRWDNIANFTLIDLFKKDYDFIGRVENKNRLTLPRVLWCGSMAYMALEAQNFHTIETKLWAENLYKLAPWPIGTLDKVKKELKILDAVGVSIASHKVKFGVFEDHNILAFTDTKDQLAILSAKSFFHNNLRKCLLEEWTHLEHNVVDLSVEQQHIYLNLISNLIDKISPQTKDDPDCF